MFPYLLQLACNKYSSDLQLQILTKCEKILKLEDIKSILKSNKLRVTDARLGVAKVLLNNKDTFFTPEEIFLNINKSKSFDCDQVSVYRVLSKYEEIGLVTKGSFKGQANRYKLQLKDTKGHSHFFKCNQCNTIEPINECFVVKKEKELFNNGYRNLEHHLEITGLCPSCAV